MSSQVSGLLQYICSAERRKKAVPLNSQIIQLTSNSVDTQNEVVLNAICSELSAGCCGVSGLRSISYSSSLLNGTIGSKAVLALLDNITMCDRVVGAGAIPPAALNEKLLKSA